MMPNITKKHLAVLLTLFSILLTQSGCSIVGRLKQPIADFAEATRVVTESTKIAYQKLNDRAMEETLLLAQCKASTSTDDCIPKLIDDGNILSSRVISDAGMKHRLDALDSLEKYVSFLSKIVNSQKPEDIAKSADELKTSIDALADKLKDLAVRPTTGGGAAGNAEANAQDSNFSNVVGLFTTAVSEVLKIYSERKRSGALKEAIQKGAVPVENLMTAIISDLNLFWTDKIFDSSDNLAKAFAPLTLDICATQRQRAKKPSDIEEDCKFNPTPDVTYTRPSDERLEKMRVEVLKAVKENKDLIDSNPKESLTAMKDAHKKMVEWATKPTAGSLLLSLEAIEAYVSSATRLGKAVVALYEKEN